MKTISGLIAAVMALSVFATAGFAYTMPSSASVASYLDASGFTTYSTASVISEYKATSETWNVFGTIESIQNVEAKSGFWMFPAGMQTSEYTEVTGMSGVAQATQWKMADANIFNGLYVSPLVHEERVDNFGTGYYGYSADIFGSGTFVSSVGINMPTDCDVEIPETPIWPECVFGCGPK